MAPPILDAFLGEIKHILTTKNAEKLREYLIIEPPFSDGYNAIIKELRQFYSGQALSQLEKKIESTLPEYEDEDNPGSWPAFANFLAQYFCFIRDVDPSELVETHEQIKYLVSVSVLALSDGIMGIVMLPTVIALSKQLARLSVGLEQHPELLPPPTITQDAERVTLVEASANTIREAFSKCLSERAAGPLDAPGPPAGKRVGIYILANICLRLFFHAKKIRSAEQVFSNVYQYSPILSNFPAAQRVVYLFFLGRYFFANNHFFRAQAVLEQAYLQCPRDAVRNRRRILIFLIVANITLGRFPSQKLLSRPEAMSPVSLADVFLPVCVAIKQGNLPAFRRALDPQSPAGAWMYDRRVLLALQTRGEVLVWRTLIRRVFVLSGKGKGEELPQFDIEGFREIAQALQNDLPPSAPSLDYQDEDFQGLTKDDETAWDEYSDQGIDGDNDGDNEMDELQDSIERDELVGGVGERDDKEHYEETAPGYLDYDEIEAGVASLVSQGLLRGYVSHQHGKFVIPGVKGADPAQVGFPQVWEHVKSIANPECPGWVTKTMNGRPKAGSRRVNLTGIAKAVGVGA